MPRSTRSFRWGTAASLATWLSSARCFGTVIYAFGALSGGPALLVVRYLGQALPLLTTQVRQHVSR